MWHDLRTAWRLRALLWVMAGREINARHAGTAGAWFWLYAQPLLTVAAYYLVFDVVFAMRTGGSASRGVGTFLIVGMLPWQAFADGISRTTTSLLDAGHLLQKNALPPILVVLRTVLASAAVYTPLLMGLVMAYWPMHHGDWSLGIFPVLVLLQCVLIWCMGHTLAILAAALRDVVQLVGFFLSVGIFCSPVLFPLDMFPAGWRWVLWLNPMTPWVLGYQSLLLHGEWPTWGMWVGMVVWVGAMFMLLSHLVRRSRDELVDWL